MHYTRTFIAIALLGAACACATLVLALTPEQHKASDHCDGVYLDTYAACLGNSSDKEKCANDAKEAREVCRKNSGLPLKTTPPKVPGDNPSGKPSPSASPRRPLRHANDLNNVQTQTLTPASPTPKPLRHVHDLSNVQTHTQTQTQTLSKTSSSPTPKPRPSRSPSHHKG